MLQLKGITKRYEAGEFSVDALKGIDLNFRKSEFVSILGPSGCGKTTMLNIVGGLDKYTSGELIINRKSTKNFNDRDWDAYRNHSVGFVFQSYNLIPHQTVLQNVELALALSGVKKAERTARAKQALDSVGLANMYKKRPSEMSGGQMQRVAIARAIVNDPDIILADEPTGALDTETSLQVMDILKEISKDRLVVMVTHNPDIAEKYSTRVVRMLDGLLVDDSNPLSEEELQKEIALDEEHIKQEAEEIKTKGKKRAKKPSLSFGTSFMLSLKNLISKRGRTILTSFAGSIGIIGIALIFAVSQGTSNYISMVQEDTLASYPLTIEQKHTDMSSMFFSFAQSAASQTEHEKDAVYEKLALYNLTKAITNIEQSENDLAAFKKHLDKQLADPNSVFSKSLNGVHYSYNLEPLIYTKYVDPQTNESTILRADTGELMTSMIAALYGVDMSTVTFTGGGMMSMLMSTSANLSMWSELLPAPDGGVINKLLKDQYDVIDGSWPAEGLLDEKGQVIPLEQQIILVVDDDNEIDDMTLYALGLKSKAEIDAIIDAGRNGTELPPASQKSWTYAQIRAQEYKTIFPFERYEYNAITKVWEDKLADTKDSGSINQLTAMYNDNNVGMKLKVVGIVRPNEDAASSMISGNICYTHAFTKYVIQQAQNAPVVQAQKNSPNQDILTGAWFKSNDLTTEKKAEEFRKLVQENPDQAYALFMTIYSDPTPEQEAAAQTELEEMDEDTLKSRIKGMLSMTNPSIAQTIDSLSDETLRSMIPSLKKGYAQYKNLMALYMQYNKPADAITKLNEDVQSMTDAQLAEWFDKYFEFASTTYEDNLIKFGCLDIDSPSSISLYAVSFAAKEDVEDAIAEYNNGVEEEQKIQYTDFVGLIMSSVTTIINAITYVLIGFVSISLIVSSIMIGVITLISVQERTKEIGILRAIGASKRNVSGMFNVETVIIGFASGLFGVLITYVLCLFVNLILHAATGIMALNAVLPIWVAAILIAISMLLTLLAGIIPSRSAAKKDPVVALRTE